MTNKPKILCLYSGGIDSTGMLWALIQDHMYNDYDILVHHIHLVNATNRFNAEYKAIQQIIPRLNQYANNRLHLSSSLIDLAFMGNKIPMDANTYGFVGANLATIDLSIEYIALGRTLDDKNAGGSDFVQIVSGVENALKQVNYLNNLPSQAKCITPVVHLTKRQIWNMLPDDIREMTWSCRTPIQQKDNTYLTCGNCHACIAIHELKKQPQNT